MSDEIRFTGKKGKEIKFEVGKKVKNNLKKADKKAFEPLFDAIEKFDGKKGISAEEFQMLKDLQTIFAKTGANQDATGYILDADDAKIAEEFANSGKNIKDFIAGKLVEINTPKETTPPAIEEKPAETPVPQTVVQETVVQEAKEEKPAEEVKEPPKKPTVTPESKEKSFNRAMQNASKKYSSENLGFTQEVTIQGGNTLYKIAEQALKDEGTTEPTRKQVNERIAQIVATNPQIKDVNNIAAGTKIKVGKGANAPAQGSASTQENPDKKTSTDNVNGTSTAPVEKPTSEYLSDSAKVVELLGADGKKYANAIKNKPELKAELEADYKYLIDKYNNDEYLTLDEQKIFDVLKNALDADRKIINSNYPEKIKELEIPAESTPMTKIPNLTGYKKEDTKVTVGEGDGAKEVTVSKYTKDGAADVYQVRYKNPIDGKEYTITEASQEAVLKLKSDLEALALQKPTEGKELTAEEKRANLEKLIKIAELRPTEGMFKSVIAGLKNDDLIDKNDPDAKALVQKLLLTRNADVFDELIKSDDNSDYSLLEHNPVAIKTIGAMLKEIRAKENAGERLTPEEIKLKNSIKSMSYIDSDDLNMDSYFIDCDGKVHRIDSNNTDNRQLSKDFTAEMNKAGDDTTKKQAVIHKFLNDPRTKEDSRFRGNFVQAYYFEMATPADQKAIIEMCDSDALSEINLSCLAGTAEEKKAAKDAYIAKAKEFFNFAQTENGTKLDPSNAVYLNDILVRIDSMNEEKNGKDADDAVIAEILNNFFVTEGEGENQTAKIKDFRRFTYEEMGGLAEAVADYGTEAQKKALADMITTDEMEDGQFVRAIEAWDGLDDVVRAKYASFVENMTKEKVLALIDKMGYAKYHIPFDKIIEKFGDDPEFLKEVFKHNSGYSSITPENLKKAFQNKWKKTEPVSLVGIQTGKYIKDYLYAWGTRNEFWTVSKDTKKVNKDTIVDIIDGFNTARTNKKEGLIECMRSDGVPKAITNRYIKALMRKAYDADLEKSDEFKNLQRFFENSDSLHNEEDFVTRIFQDSEHDQDGNEEYTFKEAKALDIMVAALHAKIKFHTRGV